MQSELNSWKQKGVVSLWRYVESPRKLEGWHLSADDDGVESLARLLRLLEAAPGCHRTVPITPPSRRLLKVPNYQQGRAKWVAPAKLQIQVSSEPDDWTFPAALEPASLSVGARHLPALIHAVEGIRRGEGDYSVGSGQGGNLWFWWWLGVA